MENKNNPTRRVQKALSVQKIKDTPFLHMGAYLTKAEQKNKVGTAELTADDYELFTTDDDESKEKSNVKVELKIQRAEFQAIRYLKNKGAEITMMSLRQATTMFMRIIDRRKSYQLN